MKHSYCITTILLLAFCLQLSAQQGGVVIRNLLDSPPYLLMRDTVTGDNDGLSISLDNGHGAIINTTDGYNLIFGTNDTSQMFLGSNGDLHLMAGNLYIDTGRLYVGDDEYFEDAGDYVVELDGAIQPFFDGLDFCGGPDNRWDAVYALNGTIQTSDARAKKNVMPISYGLESVLALRPVSFSWKDYDYHGKKLGLIAQEVHEVIPEVVKQHYFRRTSDGNVEAVETDRLGIFYSDLIPVLVQAIKDQNTFIEDLKRENERLLLNQAKIIAALEEAGINIEE